MGDSSDEPRFVLRDHASAALAAWRSRVLGVLRALLPGWAEVHEVGSTAIVGAIGKADLDFLVRVPEDRFADARAILDGAATHDPAQLTSEIYRGYRVASELDVAIQLTVKGGPHDDFLRFRDAMNASPRLVAEYNALKRAHDGAPMQAYRAAKRAFIKQVLARSGR